MKTLEVLLLFLYLLLAFGASAESNMQFLENWPAEIQEMAAMVQGKDTARYNCSIKTQDEWYETGEVSIGWAIYYITSAIFFQCIGWPILWIFLTKFSIKTHAYRVYRLIFFIGVVEITEIWGTSFWPGVSVMFGTVYCTSQSTTTIFGKITMVQWILGSTSAIFLGLHRLSDMTKKAKLLLNTSLKILLWLFLFFVYSIYGSLFFDTVLFNSLYMAPLLDPMIGNSRILYSNTFLRCHNIAVAVTLIVIYMTLCTIWSNRELSSKSVSGFQKSIIIQSTCISLTYAVPAISFVLMYYITDPPKWYIVLSDLSYQLSGGLPFIMYICLSRKVRIELFKIVGICRNYTNNNIALVSTINTTIVTF